MYSTLPLDEAAIVNAFDTLANFIRVNKVNKTMDEKVDALKLHCQSLNLSEDDTNILYATTEEMFGSTVASFAFIGVILGLHMAQFALDSIYDD